MLKTFTCLTQNLSTTKRLGKVIVQLAQKFSVSVITLEGSLGVGKTTLSKSIINHYLEEELTVTSPTFTLLNFYENQSRQVYHYDLYRLKSQAELPELGIEEAMLTKSLILIEWPGIAQAYLKSIPSIKVKMLLKSSNEQRLAIVELCN